MGRTLIVIGFIVGVSPLSLYAQVTSEKIFTGKGTLTCNGGGSSKPLFSSECKQLTITRLTTSGGTIKYEITCSDRDNTAFQMACDAYVLEQ